MVRQTQLAQEHRAATRSSVYELASLALLTVLACWLLGGCAPAATRHRAPAYSRPRIHTTIFLNDSNLEQPAPLALTDTCRAY